MEPIDSVMDKLKGLAKSSQDFINQLIHQQQTNFTRSNPVEILKRLQREAFSDLMKLRDRQDKVERMLAIYKLTKGNPFQEGNTRVRGEVDVLGAVLMMGSFDEQDYDTLKRAGIKTGIGSRFIFETIIRKKDTLIAELVASQAGERHSDDAFGNPLSLAKVCYTAHLTDWLVASAIPVGAQCSDVGKGITDFPPLGPPLLTEHNGSAFGLTVRKSKVIASVAQLVSGMDMHLDSAKINQSFSTFATVICHLSRGTKLSLLGLHKAPKLPTQHAPLGPLAIQIGTLRCPGTSETTPEISPQHIDTYMENNDSLGSIALMLESELDESLRIGGWIEMKNSIPSRRQWAITLSDIPQNELGWKLRISKIAQGNPRLDNLSACLDHFQVEGFVKINVGERLSLQPGLVYVLDGIRNVRMPALMLGSCWTL